MSVNSGRTERFVSEVRLPCLALRAVVSNSNKDVSIPRIAHVVNLESGRASGYYVRPRKQEMLIGGRYVDLSAGLIAVDVESDFEGCGDVLAHEWRHHWQFCAGWKYDGVGLGGIAKEYWSGIRSYFRRSRSEMDALKYEWRVSGYVFEPWEWAIFAGE